MSRVDSGGGPREAGGVKEVTVEELEQHRRERLDDVRNGESLQIVDGGAVTIIPADPALRLQGFRPGAPLPGSQPSEWLIEERERERSKKYRS